MTDLDKLPDWPRLMSIETAAAYTSVSPGHFRKHVQVEPIKLGKRVLYDRAAIDQFIDALTGQGHKKNWAELCDWS